MKKRKSKISKKNRIKLETISIFILIAFALVSFLFTSVLFKNKNYELSIYINGNPITEIDGKKIDISSDGTYTIGDLNSDYNIIEIKNHKVRCIDSNCSDKVCVSHGYINPDVVNDMIVCAPHRLVISCK